MEETWKLLLQTQWFFSGKLGSVPALDEAAEPQEAPLFVWRSTCVKASYSEGLYATKVTCCWREKKENNVVVEVVMITLLSVLWFSQPLVVNITELPSRILPRSCLHIDGAEPETNARIGNQRNTWEYHWTHTCI